MKYLKIVFVLCILFLSNGVLADGLCGYVGKLKGSNSNLDPGMHKAFKCLLEKVESQAPEVEGFRMAQGYRSPEEQSGLSSSVTSAGAYQSYHNYGVAFDVYYKNFYKEEKKGDLAKIRKIAKIAKEQCCLSWGGDWSSRKDWPHFQPRAENRYHWREYKKMHYQNGAKTSSSNNYSADEFSGVGSNGAPISPPKVTVSQYKQAATATVKVDSKKDLESICKKLKNDPKGLIKYDGGICTKHGGDKSGFQGLFDTISAVLSWLIKLIMIISVFALFLVGFKFIAANGNPQAMSEAKSLLINVLIGLFFVLSAFFIVNFIFDLFLIEDSYNFLEKVG